MTNRLFQICLMAALSVSSIMAKPRGQATAYPSIREAEKVLERTLGSMPSNVVLQLEGKAASGCDRYGTEAKKGILYVRGSSSVALCHGFYEYALNHGYGVSTWSGSRFSLPTTFSDDPYKETISPYRHRLYMNVCTFGYTTPWWKWDEWEREIDWMALHGFDMPLAPIGGEAILERVWLKMGLSKTQIDPYFTGPGHFPWMRMGNMTGLDGAPSDAWQKNQIQLEHKILDRMKELGMTPVLQGFAGFVPQAMGDLHPEEKLIETKWSGFRSWMLSPLSPLFSQIGTQFIKSWENEFGKGAYYLVDSFNELDVPFGEKGSKQREETLRKYGHTIYSSIASASKDAVWMMQGWMFGYQRDLWDPESVKALLSGAPDGKMEIIDLAVDFNDYIWRSENSWNYLSGFFSKEWIYSTVPNFGGRTALMGDLEFYANGHLTALKSPSKGNLIGFGTSPEGVENNEIIYELISEAGWSGQKINVKNFLHNYSVSRYGDCPKGIETFWEEMMKSSYGTCSNNARYRWQMRPYAQRMSTLGINEHYFKAIEAFLSSTKQLNKSPLYCTDALQYAALYLCSKADILFEDAQWAYLYGELNEANEDMEKMKAYLADADRLLASHPLYRMDRWIGMAKASGCSEEESNRFEEEAKRLVTVWGGPSLSDYSARVWSGLIRDYYIPRLQRYYDAKSKGIHCDFRKLDEEWHSSKGISDVKAFENPVQASVSLVRNAATVSTISHRPENAIAFWSPFELNDNGTKLNFTVSYADFERAKAVRIVPIRGSQTVTIKSIICTANRYERANEAISAEINRAKGIVDIPLHKLDADAPLSKEVNISISINNEKAADNFAAVEFVY